MLPLRHAGRRRRAALLAPPPSAASGSREQCHPPCFAAGARRHQSVFWAGIRARMLSTCAEHHDFTARAGLSARLTQADIVSALRKGDRHRASILLSNLQRTKEALTSEDFSHLLEYCAEAPDPLFVMDILEIMEDKAIDISKGNYRSVTRALTKGGYSKETITSTIVWYSFCT